MHKHVSCLKKNLRELKKLDVSNFYQSDFLLTWEKSADEIKAVLLLAEALKELHYHDQSLRIFDSGTAIAIFRDASIRSRVNFASAINALGLGFVELDEVKARIAHGAMESETAIMLSFLTEVIGIRDDMYLGEGDKYQRNFREAVIESCSEGVLAKKPSIINLRSDLDHPVQSLADLLKLKEHFGSLEKLRGKKIAVSWAYAPTYVTSLAVPQATLALLSRFGMEISLAHPPGYELLPDVLTIAKTNAQSSGGKFNLASSMDEAFKNVDVVYPISWAPFKLLQKRTELLKAGGKADLKALDAECLAQNAKYKNWECTREKIRLTKGSKALYMHSLPADISGLSCKEGGVSAEVFEQYRRDTYYQASFKPFVLAAMIFLMRLQEPFLNLEKLIKSS